jgi:hypothetical protein
VVNNELISKEIPKSVMMWRLLGRNSILSIIVILFIMSPSFKIRAEVQKHSVSSSDEISDKAVQFVFISEIGAMVGGSSAVSNSKYISESGLVQVSKEETNGVLHTLMTGLTDTSVFFENIGKGSNACPQMESPNTAKESGNVTEYYPPTTYIAYSFFSGSNEVCEYIGEVSNSDLVKNFVDQVSDLVAGTKLSPDSPGLYVRTSRNPTSNLNLIAFDLQLKRSDLPSFVKLNQMIANEMAMIRVREKNGRAVIAGDFTIQAGDPVHLIIGKEAYLLFPFRYDPHK